MVGGTHPCVPPCFKKVNLKPSLAKTHSEVSRRVIVTLALGVQEAEKLPLVWVALGWGQWWELSASVQVWGRFLTC